MSAFISIARVSAHFMRQPPDSRPTCFCSEAMVETKRQPLVASSAPLAGSAVYQPSELPATARMS